jgi:predicted MFS family arabinose efflux permease
VGRNVTSVLIARVRALKEPLAHPVVRRLWAAQFTSELGDWAARLALGVLVFQRTHSPAVVGLVTAASMLGWFGPGQLLVSLTERFPRRRVMITADLVRLGAFGLALAPLPVPVLVMLVALAGCATPPFEAARSALRPEVTPPELLGAAITVTQLTGDASILSGYLIGGALVSAVGPYPALAANAATFAVSALQSARLPRRESPREVPPRRLRAAAALLSQAPVFRRALVLVLVTQAGSVGVEALVVPYAEQEVGAGAGWAAVLAAVGALACLAATAALPLKGDPGTLLRRCAVLSVSAGAVTVAAFALLPAWGGILPFAAAGCLMVVLVPANVVVGPALPDSIRASAFGLLVGSTVAAQAAGAAVAGLLASVTAVPTAAALMATPALAAGLHALLRPVYPEPAGDAAVPASQLPAQQQPA